MKLIIFCLGCIITGLAGCNWMQEKEARESASEKTAEYDPKKDTLKYPDEKHLRNVRQLTFGGENAEAYWSFDGRSFVFQATNESWDAPCDQIFKWQLADGDMRLKSPANISGQKGRATCAFFLPGDSLILFSSTMEAGEACPSAPERKKGQYYWPVYGSYDIFVANTNGQIVKTLAGEPGYDAEATVSPKGDRIVFTSDRNGDLDLFIVNIDGTGLKQITSELGYDGGAFFSPDGQKIVFRASRPQTAEEKQKYKDLLKMGLVEPKEMEIFICDADGSNLRQVTSLGKANWAPGFHPSGKKILFSSNHESDRGFQFNLYMIDLDGANLEKVSHDETFDAFPMFSPDGSRILFSSNRFNGGTRNTNVFMADWVD
jgi:TolB protein